MEHDIENELFRLQAKGLQLGSDEGLVRITFSAKSSRLLTREKLLSVLQSLPDAAGVRAIKRAARRAADFGM